MSRKQRASLLTYLGIIMIVIGWYPFMATHLDASRTFEAIWHLWLFIGAAVATFGIESMRLIMKPRKTHARSAS